MSKTRLWLLCGSLAIVAVLVAGWFVVAAPQRSNAAALRTQTATEIGGTASVRTQISVAKSQSKQLPAKQAELAKFARQITPDPGLPSLVRTLSQAADDAGADLVSISPGPPAAFVSPTASTTLPAARPSAPASTTTPTAPAAATSPLQSVALTMKLNGTYSQLEQLMANLEGMQRMLLVGGFALAPGERLKPASAAPATSPAAGAAPAAAGAPTGCSKDPCSLSLSVTGQVFMTPALTVVPVPANLK